MAKLEMEVTVEGAEKAAAAFEALALAADKAREAIEKLADIKHVNLSIAMVGDVMHCEVTPVSLVDVREAVARGVKRAARLA